MSKISVQDIVATIETLSTVLEIPPREVSLKHLTEAGVAERQVRNNGGLGAIRKAYFPEVEKDLKGIVELKENQSYIKQLETKVGSAELKEARLLEAVQKNLKPLPKIKCKKLKITKSTDKVEVVGMLNDTHIGLIVDSEEIGGINEFDFQEACRRFALYVKSLAGFKKHKRNQVSKLHLVLNGDLISGLIHGLDTKGIHLMIHQINGAVHIFTHTIANLLNEYPEIEVHGVAGNHDRGVHKNHGQRAVGEVYDSYANIVFYSLSTAFRNNPQVKFNFPKAAYGFINLPAGRAMYAHGDHIFSKALGNPGSSINVKGLTNAIRDFNGGEVTKGNEPIKLLLLGHVHSFAHFITSDGVEVYVAPSLSGLDTFAHSLTINNNFCAQVLFESTKDYILADSRLVRLSGADKDKSLDLIIPSYNKELKWKK